jgi:hypothetical protein
VHHPRRKVTDHPRRKGTEHLRRKGTEVATEAAMVVTWMMRSKARQSKLTG